MKSATLLYLVVLSIFLFTSNETVAQTNYSLNFIGRITFPANTFGCGAADTSDGSDVWGYTAPDSSEYALM